MPGQLTNDGCTAGLDATLKGTAPPSGPYYMGLATADPGVGALLTTVAEVSATGYARQSSTWSTASGTPLAENISATITYGPFTASTGSGASAVTYCFLSTVASGTTGKIFAKWQLAASKTAAQGESFQIGTVSPTTVSMSMQ